MAISRIVTPAQCKAARTLLGWNTRQLAEHAQVAQNTVLRFERGERVQPRTVLHLQRMIEEAGLEFYGDQSAARSDATFTDLKLNDTTGVRFKPNT